MLTEFAKQNHLFSVFALSFVVIYFLAVRVPEWAGGTRTGISIQKRKDDCMLKLYICPSCRGTRYVSLENTTCYHCNCPMVLSNLPYADFIEMGRTEREQHVQDFMVQYTKAEQSHNLPKDTSMNIPLQENKHMTKLILNPKRNEPPIYEQEPVSRKHREEIILMSNLRLFHGVS